MPVEVGIGPAIKKREKTFPFIVVIPQAEGFGWGADTANAKRALAMLDEVKKEYKIDPKRQYLTGPVDGRVRHLEHGRGVPGPVGRHRPDLRPRRPEAAPRRSRTSRAGASTATRTRAVNVSGIARHDRGPQEGRRQARSTPSTRGVGHNSWDKAYAHRTNCTPGCWSRRRSDADVQIVGLRLTDVRRPARRCPDRLI